MNKRILAVVMAVSLVGASSVQANGLFNEGPNFSSARKLVMGLAANHYISRLKSSIQCDSIISKPTQILSKDVKTVTNWSAIPNHGKWYALSSTQMLILAHCANHATKLAVAGYNSAYNWFRGTPTTKQQQQPASALAANRKQ